MSQTQQMQQVSDGPSHYVLPPGAIRRTSSRSAANGVNRSLNALLNAPARRDQPHLHPRKLNGALWFKVDKTVGKYIRTIWQNNFMGPWWNWSMVPQEKKDAWWADFVQNYYWDARYYSLVYKFWKEECMASIKDRVSSKKRTCKKKKTRNDIKPDYINDVQWKAMHEKWVLLENLKKSEDAANSRTTNIEGNGMHKHCAGPVAFASIENAMMMEAGGEEPPPYPELVKKTHTQKDGTYVDKRVEAIISEVELCATQMAVSQGSSDDSSVVPSRLILNKAFLQVVKPNKAGQIPGLCDTVKMVKDCVVGMQNVQNVILRGMGIDPITLQPIGQSTGPSPATAVTPTERQNATPVQPSRQLDDWCRRYGV